VILLIDNYDSFTWNLAQYLGELGAPPTVRRNDELTVEDVERMKPAQIVISPGPGRPEAAGISVATIRRLGATFGGTVVRADELMHGKVSAVHHDGRGVFKGLAQPFQAGRYHSLVIADPVPDELEVAARTEAGTIMGVRHRAYPIHGVQFHPESVLTSAGRQLLRNFLEL
jgi:anthranilate/para-aminobenzoate synthase component II